MVPDRPTDISIRRANANDAVETAAVFSAALHNMAFFPKLHSEEEHRAFVARFIDSAETWLALSGGRIVGLACLRGDRLEQLYVHPSFHNRGAGSLLLAKVREERPSGFQLWTFQVNAGARRFYERHGCKAVEFTDGARNEEKLPDVRYVWSGTKS